LKTNQVFHSYPEWPGGVTGWQLQTSSDFRLHSEAIYLPGT